MTIAQGVLDWVRQQPLWQQDLARRVARAVELDEEEIDEVLAVVKAAHGIDTPMPASEPVALTMDDLPSLESGRVATLLKFGRLQGVGMVVEDSQIEFSPVGITVIYGPNAAGKTSYVRGLKALCQTVDRGSKVLGNVFGGGSPPPSADVEYRVDDAVCHQRTPLVGKVHRLPGISVFDSACAELYVNDKNAIQYIPGPLLVLTRMAAVQTHLRYRLEHECDALKALRPTYDGLPEDTDTGRAVRSLTGAPTDLDLASFARIGPEDHKRIETLRAAVAAAEASTAAADAAVARVDAQEAETLAQALEELAARCGEEAATQLVQAATENDAAKAARQFAIERFRRAPVTGIGSEPWALLWEAARSFVESEGGAFPPGTEQRCPLCLQEIDQETAGHMADFEAHVRSAVNAAAAAAAARLSEALDSVAPSWADRCRTPLLTRLQHVEPELASRVATYLNAAAAHLAKAADAPRQWTALAARPDDQILALRTWATGRKAHAEELQKAVDAAQLAELRRELQDLEAKLVLAARLEEFKTWRRRLQSVTKIEQAHTALATNRVTTQQRQLAETLIAGALTAALGAELEALRCSHLPVSVDMTTARAETSVGLRLISQIPADLSSIVSEGERRAIALAFFLAELTMMPGDAGIVVDDPVSSLDDGRRKLIAHRLVRESAHRQVIVFTHDLPFLADLQSQAEAARQSVEVRGMWRLGDGVGRVDDHPPFKAMKLKQRIGVLDQRVQNWDSDPPTTQEAARQRVVQFYADLRTSWERAVEERLFQGVVQRLQRDVKTLSLRHVTVTPDLAAMVENGMTRASHFVHDEPLGATIPLPGQAEVAEDLQLLKDFAKAVPIK
jgi:energy-coupling factor transporter ATP-binding protein EcfA2